MVHALAVLKVPDALGNAARTSEDLAAELGTSPADLGRSGKPINNAGLYALLGPPV